jgi:hypothetical protein
MLPANSLLHSFSSLHCLIVLWQQIICLCHRWCNYMAFLVILPQSLMVLWETPTWRFCFERPGQRPHPALWQGLGSGRLQLTSGNFHRQENPTEATPVSHQQAHRVQFGLHCVQCGIPGRNVFSV